MTKDTEFRSEAEVYGMEAGTPEWKSEAWSNVYSMLHFDVDAVPNTDPTRHGWLLDTLLNVKGLTNTVRSALLQLVLDMVDRGVELERMDEDGVPQKVTDIGHPLVSSLHSYATTQQVEHLVTHYAKAGNFDINELNSTSLKSDMPRSLLETAVLRSSPGAVCALLELGIDQSKVPCRSIGLSRTGPDGTAVYAVIEPGDFRGYVECMFDEKTEMLGHVRAWFMRRDIAEQQAAEHDPAPAHHSSAGRRRLL